jgi:O-antigen/teichoic acid export membrane protein
MNLTKPLDLAKNYLFLSSGELFSKIITFVAVAYLAQLLGPADFGIVEFSGAVLLCASLIVDQGFGLYGAREIAKNSDNTGQLVTEVVSARIILSLLSYIAIVAFAYILNRSQLVTEMLLLYGLSLIGFPFLLQWVFQGYERMRTVAAIQVIRQGVYAGVIFTFIRSPQQILVTGLAELAGVVAAALYGIWIYTSKLHGMWQRKFTISKRLFLEGTPIGLSQIFWTLRMFAATIILGIIATPKEVGYFAGAMRIDIALHSFVFLYFFNLLPTLSQTWSNHDHSFQLLERQSLKLVAWLSFGSGIFLFLAAPVLIRFIYGNAYTPAVMVLRILVGSLILAALSGHYRFGLVASGHQKAEMGASGLGALVVLITIPIGYFQLGIIGAAFGLLLSEFVVWTTTWAWSSWKTDLKGHLGILVKPFAASLIAAGALAWLPVNSLWVEIIMSGFLFFGLACIFEPGLRKKALRLIQEQAHRMKNNKPSPTI